MASVRSGSWLHVLVVVVAMATLFLHALAATGARRGGGGSGNPTVGFEKVELADGDFVVQSPYNVPESQRFRYRDGVRTLWV